MPFFKKTSGHFCFFMIMLSLLGVCYASLITYLTHKKVYNDTSLIFISSYLLNRGENPYMLTPELKQYVAKKQQAKAKNTEPDLTLGIVEKTTIPNLSPPFATMLVSFFSRFISEQQFSLGIKLLCIIGELVALYFLSQRYFQHQKWFAYFSFILINFSFMGTVYNISFGEIALLLNFLLIVSTLCYEKKKDFSAGILLAFAANIKLFFAIFLLLFLAQKRYRALCSFILAGIFFATLPFYCYGLVPYQGYLKALSELYWYPVNWNASYLGILSRIFGDKANYYHSLFQFPVITFIIYYGLVAGYAVFIFKFCQALKDNVIQAVALLVPCMLLLSPLGWYYYFPLLILSFLHLFKKIQQKKNYLIYVFSFLTLLLVINFPVGVQMKHSISLAFQLTIGSYLFACLFLFHCMQLHCCLKDKRIISIEETKQRLLSKNILMLIFTVIFSVSTAVGFWLFIAHYEDVAPEFSFINTKQQPFTILLKP